MQGAGEKRNAALATLVEQLSVLIALGWRGVEVDPVKELGSVPLTAKESEVFSPMCSGPWRHLNLAQGRYDMRDVFGNSLEKVMP
eukprot:5375574-Amphidinium_carterae.1